ncbi:S9 family peptidase [Sphingomonas sinipercae]|uniref:S9 family peptidase n=1 Tax=Sphingomonas sinipercae TaxID=2714944 RepID=A0A6G7ZMH3_9SPHN|nr:alpha/beta fold hydrolase [Sphingomonas sinipercae]QIL02118.1 S9 family peptidase [Sphingomonas sinipercae]
MYKALLLASAIALGVAPAGAQTSLVDDANAFGSREDIHSADLSPNGHRVAYLRPSQGAGMVAFVADLDTGAIQTFLKSAGAAKNEKIDWCGFVTDIRLICEISWMESDAGKLIPFSRTVAINSDGTGVKLLGQSASYKDERIRQFDGTIIDWRPGGDGAVLMQREYVPETNTTGSRVVRTDDGLGVDWIDSASMATKIVENPRRGVGAYLTDGRGNVRVRITNEEDGRGLLTGRRRIDFRTASSREWRLLSGYGGQEIVPLAIDASVDSLYALKKLDGRYALYRMRLTDPVSTELVASNPRVDIDDVVRSAQGGQVIGYSFVDDRRQTIYFDASHKALAESLNKALPGLPLIRFVADSQDGTRSLVFAGSDSDPGRYYLYDRSAKKLDELFLARPQLEKHPIAKVQTVTATVADGTQIPAYLTLPAGKDPKNLPAVVLPHGGPSSRDEWGFDWIAQFLAARGYAVIQPNYRGSAGFGDQWLVDNGFKSWRTSIGDITGSIRWLVKQGIADPNRLAVVGWSYGGYAALQAAATEPDLFKAVAAIAPATDLALLKSEARGYARQALVADFVGKGPHIEEGSPLRRAGAIRAPVLLAHGDLDLNVSVDHSVKMDSALRSSGKTVELLRFRTLDHQLDDGPARRELLRKIGELLQRTIGQ